MPGPVSGSTISELIGDLKQYYSSEQVINDLMLKNRPLFGLVEKDFEISGQGGNIQGTPSYPTTAQGGYPVPIISSGGASPSQTFANAQTNQQPAVVRQFQVPVVSTFNLATVNRVLQGASRNNTGAFLDAMKLETDAAFQSVSNYTAAALYRNATGSFGQVNSSGVSAGGVIQLTNITDAINFNVNAVLRAAASDGGTLRNGTGYVIAVDFSLGTLTVSGSAPVNGVPGTGGIPSGWSAGDYLVFDGSENLMIAGLLTYLPNTSQTRPTPGFASNINQLFNVDRSISPQVYAGTWLQAGTESIEEALIDGVSEVCRLGGMPDMIFMNPVSYRALCKELQSRRHYITAEGPTGISYSGITIDGDQGPVKVLSDPWCPPKTAFILTMSTWKMIGYQPFPDFLQYMDGMEYMRVYNADAIEMRCGGDINLTCNAPGWNGVINLNQ